MQLIGSNKNIFFPRVLILAMCSGCLYSSICWLALNRFFWIETVLVILSVFYVYTHLINQKEGPEDFFVVPVIGRVIQVFLPKTYIDSLIVLSLLVMLLFFIANPIYWVLLIVLISFYSIDSKVFQIRKKAILKPLFISLCWTLILLEPIFRINFELIDFKLTAIVALHFIYFFILSVIDDVRDISFKEKEITTLPVKYNYQKLRFFLTFLLIVFYFSCFIIKPIDNALFVSIDFLLFLSLFFFFFFAKSLSSSYIWLAELHIGLLGLEYILFL